MKSVGFRFLLLLAVLAASPLAAGPSRRPAVDLSAMREAMGDVETTGSVYPSAASYAHFLKARLAHHDGDHRRSLDELRLALASDDRNPYLMTELAEQYARLTELDRAEEQLKRVLELHPTYQPGQLLMGRVLYEAQKTTRARAHLSRAIKLRPQDPDAYLVLTQLELDQGRVDEAVKAVERLGAALPGEPVGYRRLGMALLERGDTPRAEKMLLRAVDRDAGDFEAWVALGTLYERSDRPVKALEAYGHALERDPESKEVLLAAGRLALRNDAKAEAKAYFDQLLSLSRDPELVVKVSFSYIAVRQLEDAAAVLETARKTTEEPRLHFYAGLIHERLRAWRDAERAFGAVPTTSGDLYWEAQLHRATALSWLNQHRAALDAFKKVQASRPGMTGLEVAHARALENAGQAKEAELILVRAFAARPGPDVLEGLAGFFERQGRGKDAIAMFKGAVTRAPEDDTVRFALAAAYDRDGQWELAVKEMREVLKRNPTNPAAMNFVGYTLAQHGAELDEAERLVRKALDAQPESAAYLDSLGWVMFKRGHEEKAMPYLLRAADQSPDDPTLLEHLGRVQLKLGREKEAAEAFKRAIESLAKNPDTAERRGQRAELEQAVKELKRGR